MARKTRYNCTVKRIAGADLEFYWSLNQSAAGSGLYQDLSSNNRDGTVTGGQVFPSLVNGGGSADAWRKKGGGGDIRTPASMGLSLTEWTVGHWDQMVQGAGNSSVWRTASGTGVNLTTTNPDWSRRLTLPNGSTLTESTGRAIGTTYMTVCTFDGSTGKIYRNNQLAAQGSGSGTWTLDQFETGNLGDLAFDEIFVASRAFTIDEVERLYDCGSAGTNCFSCGGGTMWATWWE